ncbi:MAG: AmmeMemoRadiSam system radical SAM enzyme [Promethearchaeota archaeon]|jgi:pyruvate formate lyase activating enzyme
MDSEFEKKSKYQRKIDETTSQCLTCERRCKIPKGKSGFCKTRINKDGEIYTIVYGLVPALSINPIEKKPFYHFHPGSKALTIGTYGCNFSCFWCQNHHISKQNPLKLDHLGESHDFLSPEGFMDIALKNRCEGTSISFNEPTLLFEYSLEVFELATQNGLYNTYVTNGYMTKEVLKDLVGAGLDAMNIDIKGNSDMVQKYCGVNNEIIWRNAKVAKDLGVHLEITTLLITELNTDEKTIRNISKKIISCLGDDTPLHLSRFFPHYKSVNHGLPNPTPLDYLYNAYKVAKNEGLKFVYLGNIPNTSFYKTECPNCSKIVIERDQFTLKKSYLDVNGNCNFCGYYICSM